MNTKLVKEQIMEYQGSIRILKPETLQAWIDKGWYQEQIKEGYIYALGCGRFRKEKCECFKCRRGQGTQRKEVLKNNGLL